MMAPYSVASQSSHPCPPIAAAILDDRHHEPGRERCRCARNQLRTLAHRGKAIAAEEEREGEGRAAAAVVCPHSGYMRTWQRADASSKDAYARHGSLPAIYSPDPPEPVVGPAAIKGGDNDPAVQQDGRSS
jgi:hypothetical protein